jgi:hypothetical protein
MKWKFLNFLLLVLIPLAVTTAVPGHWQQQAVSGREEGFGRVHMDISCSPAVAAEFDRALALLHNFWYVRALERFSVVVSEDPGCSMAYWGAAMTYNHPFWDPPSPADEQAAWRLVEQGLSAKEASPREKLYLAAVAALYRDGGAGSKAARDQSYRDAMAAAYARYPDDETALFYGLSILGAVPEGSKGFAQQKQAAELFEAVHARHPDHPGVLHYLIHAYDDPVHAELGLPAARGYAQAAAAVPHALHMPSHIFTRLGYWEESAATNLKGWQVSEADVQRAGESGAYRDFHNLTYLEYAYLQLGRFRDAKHTVDIAAAQYQALPDKTTASDTPELESRHVRGRTIYRVPDRVVFGYFDMLVRYVVETADWHAAASLPLLVPSRDFRAVQLELEAMAAAAKQDPAGAGAAAGKLAQLAEEPGQHPFARQIITLQAKEAAALAARAAGNKEETVARMKEAVAIEDSIDDLSQPPYPPIPANELFGTLLLDLHRPSEAAERFALALQRTPGRPKSVYGIARAAETEGDIRTATERYAQFLKIWANADPDRPEIAVARQFLERHSRSTP